MPATAFKIKLHLSSINVCNSDDNTFSYSKYFIYLHVTSYHIHTGSTHFGALTVRTQVQKPQTQIPRTFLESQLPVEYNGLVLPFLQLNNSDPLTGHA